MNNWMWEYVDMEADVHEPNYMIGTCIGNGCGVDIYNTDPHEAYIGAGEERETPVFLAHYDCSPDPLRYEKLRTSKGE